MNWGGTRDVAKMVRVEELGTRLGTETDLAMAAIA